VITITARNIDKHVDACMTSTECLASLADGNDKEASFKLRNDNKLQLYCLEGRTMPDKLQKKCGQWDNCVSKSATHKKTLVALLRAGVGGEQAERPPSSSQTTTRIEAERPPSRSQTTCAGFTKTLGSAVTGNGVGDRVFYQSVCECASECAKNGACVGFVDNYERVPPYCALKTSTSFSPRAGKNFFSKVGNGGSLTQVDVTANEAASATDPNACVDPAADDAESWDCECLDDMVSGCGGSDSDSLEECLRGRMCTLHAVCGHWKQDNCPTAMIQNKSTDAPAKLLQRQKGQEDMDLSGSLDGSLEGKCTSETQ